MGLKYCKLLVFLLEVLAVLCCEVSRLLQPIFQAALVGHLVREGLPQLPFAYQKTIVGHLLPRRSQPSNCHTIAGPQRTVLLHRRLRRHVGQRRPRRRLGRRQNLKDPCNFKELNHLIGNRW